MSGARTTGSVQTEQEVRRRNITQDANGKAAGAPAVIDEKKSRQVYLAHPA